ncbi:MAG: metallophosphoesterase [Gammaproteobacteria bacterium]|jgi:hypothetical protein|nr:metallophosphoesterase [Gammaproteobacteria bacterium]
MNSELVSRMLRIVLSLTILLASSSAFSQEHSSLQVDAEASPRQFRVWAFADSHVGTDISFERESLAEAIRQSEQGGDNGGPPFEWDIAVSLGDFAGGFGVPTDEEGQELVRQFGALETHRREDIYSLAGNHDATTYTEPTQWWFRKWIDPLGENTQFSGVDSGERNYPITGDWEKYSFRIGNLLFLMMSDRNDLPPPVGRGRIDASQEVGGYPAGAVTSETFSWWQDAIADNPNAIIVSAHHHMLKETTTGSGPWEGFTTSEDGSRRALYHGLNPGGAPEGASYLYFLDDKPDAMAFEGYLSDSPNAIDIWLGAHTHISPARETGGRKYLEQKWGVNFINVAALSRYHNPLIVPPSSRLLTFTEGSDEVKVQYYLHTNDYYYQGWYKDAEVTITISKPFYFNDN